MCIRDRINYTRETYSSSTTATTTGVSVNRNLPGITAGEVFMHKFGTSTVVTQDFYFYPDLSDIDQYRFAVDFASVTKINKWLAWQFSLSDRYVTDPPIVGTKTCLLYTSPVPGTLRTNRKPHQEPAAPGPIE